MILMYNKEYSEIENDYYYKLGFSDAIKGKTYWGLLAFTAGLCLSYELMKEFLK